MIDFAALATEKSFLGLVEMKWMFAHLHDFLNLTIIYLVKELVNATIFGSHKDSTVCRAPDGHNVSPVGWNGEQGFG